MIDDKVSGKRNVSSLFELLERKLPFERVFQDHGCLCFCLIRNALFHVYVMCDVVVAVDKL